MRPQSHEIFLLNTSAREGYVIKIIFFKFLSQTYSVVGTQKNHLNEHSKHMMKLSEKKLFSILHATFWIIWTYVLCYQNIYFFLFVLTLSWYSTTANIIPQPSLQITTSLLVVIQIFF